MLMGEEKYASVWFHKTRGIERTQNRQMNAFRSNAHNEKNNCQ